MIVCERWCRVRMTLFHHLKLKRPRMNSVDGPSMSSTQPRKNRTLENGNGDSKDAGNSTPLLSLIMSHS